MSFKSDVDSTFSGFSVNDVAAVKQFYSQVLGCEAADSMGGLEITLPGGQVVWAYTKPDHQPASYTTLNFVVTDIAATVTELTERGVKFLRYDGFPQDDQGIMHGKDVNMGPNIAWFKDPAGNILAVLEK